MGRPGPPVGRTPSPSIPAPPSPIGCGDDLSSPILITVGTRDGCINRPGATVVCVAETPPARIVGAGSAVTLPRLMGVDTVRAAGNPTVFHSGNSSNNPRITACSPNEVNVVKLRRVRWPHEVSSMLSANIPCSNIASSSVKSVCWYGHRETALSPCRDKEKRPRFHAAFWNFLDTKGVRSRLLWRLARLRSWLCSSSRWRFRSSRFCGSCSCRRWRCHTRLHIVGVDHCLRDVSGLSPP